MDTKEVALLYRGVLYVEAILYSKEYNWYTRCCPLNGGVRYRECPLREAVLYYFIPKCLKILLASKVPQYKSLSSNVNSPNYKNNQISPCKNKLRLEI